LYRAGSGILWKIKLCLPGETRDKTQERGLAATHARFDTTEGTFTVRLFDQEAPKTVENFVGLAQGSKQWSDPRTNQKVTQPYYDGTIFHRVIDGFMIQGGGFSSDMKQKETRAPIENEAGAAAKGGLKNEMGTLAMARTSVPNSATAQFFINVKDNGFLDYRDPSPQGIGYAVFGRVVDGMNTVLRISRVDTTTVGPYQNVPQRPIVIESVTVKASK
jgi:peptidyl-prolyl cis-trans isomerase A (cyclophilin A)